MDEDDDSYPDDTHWEVIAWNKGTTESGSSGSGLFNSFQHIIGQLEGGFADCNGTQPDGEGDWYGKFSYSWTNNGNSSHSNRLDYWLDPLNTGIEILNGYDPYYVNDSNNIIVNYHKEEDSIKTYPNPANDMVNIEADIEMLFCAIYSINGQCVNEISVNSSKIEFGLNSYPAGIYLLKIKTGNALIHKKLIIQK